jgi:hypothetical protein
MSSFASEPILLDIEDVQHLRETAGEIRLRVSGRWRGESPPADAESALLVIQIEGRRHRFAPVGESDPRTAAAPDRWTASFVVPGWAEPRREGQAALWIGEAVVPIPPIGASRRWPGGGAPALGSAVPVDLSDVADAAVAPVPPAPPGPAAAPRPALAWEPVEPSSEPGRAGPLADMLLKETVAALHGELQARAAETTRLRSALAGAQSELEARGGSQTELDGTLGELGAELRRLMEAVEEQRRELDLREIEGAREREESERRLAELAVARDDQAAELVAVREELASAREELAGALDRHSAELASTREDHAAELAALREQHATRTGAEREQAAAELRELQAQLTAAQHGARRHAGENGGLREELAAAQVAREAARSEVAGLHAELERLGGELAVTRERVQSENGDLGQANRLLADARALAEQLRARPAAR